MKYRIDWRESLGSGPASADGKIVHPLLKKAAWLKSLLKDAFYQAEDLSGRTKIA